MVTFTEGISFKQGDQVEVNVIKTVSRQKLDFLIQQTPESKRALFAEEMKGFEELFHRYLQSRGKMIEWEKIHPPREG